MLDDDNALTREEAAKAEFFKDSDDEENFILELNAKTCCHGFLKSLDCMKVICMVAIISYFWMWTATNRLWEVDVLEQMCYRKELNLTFHDDKIV